MGVSVKIAVVLFFLPFFVACLGPAFRSGRTSSGVRTDFAQFFFSPERPACGVASLINLTLLEQEGVTFLITGEEREPVRVLVLGEASGSGVIVV
jgi:hypothetical protein